MSEVGSKFVFCANCPIADSEITYTLTKHRKGKSQIFKCKRMCKFEILP